MIAAGHLQGADARRTLAFRGGHMVSCRPLSAVFVQNPVFDSKSGKTQSLAEERRTMDTRFAAAYLGYSPATLRLWRRKGEGPKFYNVGRFVEYRQEDLNTWSGGEEAVALRKAERRAKTGTKVRTGKRSPASDYGQSLGVNTGTWS